jgi:ankyrin repeat protein
VEVVTLLLEAGAAMEAQDHVSSTAHRDFHRIQEHNTPLAVACAKGHPEVVVLLLKAGAKIGGAVIHSFIAPHDCLNDV